MEGGGKGGGSDAPPETRLDAWEFAAKSKTDLPGTPGGADGTDAGSGCMRGVVSGGRPQLTRVQQCGDLPLAVSIPVHQLAKGSARLPKACLPIGAAAAARGAGQSKPRQQRGNHCVWRDGSHCVWRD